LCKIYEKNSPGLAVDTERVTIEHLASENPASGGGPTAEQIASIGNLILVTQDLNDKLANKDFAKKKEILRNSGVWVDDVILGAKDWGWTEIQKRAKVLADEAFNDVWKL